MKRVQKSQTLVLHSVDGAEEMTLRRSSPSTPLLRTQTLTHHLPLHCQLPFIRGKGSVQQDRGAIFGAMHAHCTRTCTPALLRPHARRVIRKHAYFGLAVARYCSSLQQDGEPNQSQWNQWKTEGAKNETQQLNDSRWHSQALITLPWLSQIRRCPRFLHGYSLLTAGNWEIELWVEYWKVQHIYCRGLMDVAMFLWKDVLFAYVFLYCMYFFETIMLWYSQ